MVKIKKTIFLSISSLLITLIYNYSASNNVNYNNKGNCYSKIYLVNASDDQITLLGVNQKISVSPNASGEYLVKLKSYYNDCSRFDIRMHNGKINKMLVNKKASNISVRYQKNNIFTAGVTVKDADSYVKWHGLKDII